MTTAVENGVAGLRLNGHSQHTTDLTNERWDEQFLPPPLRIDDAARAQKVLYLFYSLRSAICRNFVIGLRPNKY